MISVYLHENGRTRCVDRVEPQWLDPESRVTLWADLSAPTPEESKQVLVDTFDFHPLAVEDAMSEIHHPKVESYDGYLYLILHGIAFEQRERRFQTRDVDFFIGRNYLVTVHDGRSRSVARLRDMCEKHQHLLEEGPVGLLHRVVDSMVDHYRPEIEALEQRIDTMEHEAALGGRESLVRQILALKRDLSSLRRVVIPQRDAVGRLARREFPIVADEMAYRFRDVYDHLVRLSEEAAIFQDRVTGILDAHLASVSNQLALVSKVLAGIAVILGPLTVFTGMFGMNVALPVFPGGENAQFWWISAIMGVMTGVIYYFFRRRNWL